MPAGTGGSAGSAGSSTLPGTGAAAGSTVRPGTGGSPGNGAPGKPGVQLTNGAGAPSCVPLCVLTTDPALDPQGDDYGYEAGTSCVIPHTATATNDTCITGGPLPAGAPRPGVVVRNTAGARTCAPKCVFYTSPTQKGANSDGFADDWAYENNSTCVIPGTPTAATGLSCTTGMPVPPELPRPGVTVLNPTTKGLECVATCTYYTNPTQVGANGDNLGDDWAYEFGGSCIIPGTVTSFNDACTTLQPVPAARPRPGIMVNSDPVMDSCKTTMCVPLCQHVTRPPSAAYPDWGWENNNSCVIAGSPSATTVPKGVVDPTLPALPPPGPTRKCTWGAAPVDFLRPPPLNPTLVGTRPLRFQTTGRVLNDAYGRPFLIRGVNNSNAWYDICGQYSAYQGLDAIAAQGANAVRVGWAFQSIDPVGPDMGAPLKNVIGTSASLLAEILFHIVELKMVPILALNDSTGQTTPDWPLKMAQFLEAPAYAAVLKAYEPYLLLGIANEWNGIAADYAGAYTAAIQSLRTNRVNNTLVITANDWGQGCQSVLDNAATLTAADPLRNLLYDVHLYNYITFTGIDATGHGGTADYVTGCMDRAATLNIPLLVGEFGNVHGTPALPTAVAYQTIIARANANAQGYTPWVWYGDTEFPQLNLASSWSGPLTAWGRLVVPQMAGVKATIFP
jgi:mannan endo-1,4-beta-mannosidase